MRLYGTMVLLFFCAAPALAQRSETRFATTQDTVVIKRPGWTVMRIAKWGTLLASTGAAAYGFTQNRVADREYEDIERICQADAFSCERNSADQYVDASLEARYQSVVRRDDRAKLALLAGQVGIAASVLMFILDLPKNTAPDDIPYEPNRLRLDIAPTRIGLVLRTP